MTTNIGGAGLDGTGFGGAEAAAVAEACAQNAGPMLPDAAA